MKPALIDTDILSLFLRNNTNVVNRFREYLESLPQINFSIITYYEILSGLRYKDARRQLETFLAFADQCNIFPATVESMNISADIYADLRSRGELIDDIDILIAGVALANDMAVVTANRSHFGRITGLEVADWNN